MQELLSIDDVEHAAALMKPVRLDVLRRMAEETTCTEVAALLGTTPQKIHYHVKALENAGLVEKVAERKVRGILEGIYRAKARAYWLSPRLGGPRRSADQASLGYLIQLAEEVQDDVATLAVMQGDEEHVSSLGLSAQVVLRDAAERAAFLRDVQRTFQELAERYGARRPTKKASTYRIALACYPKKES